MKQPTACTKARTRPTAAPNMPQQTPPIDRTEAAASIPNAAAGVEASIIAPPFDWNKVWTGMGNSPYNPFGGLNAPYIVY
ncbi:hypothetical protein [Streptomyces sp. NPDC096324]|uniref:hypothetical protein n=1 Tax=Streptomyces sp. NPDC096324 TaxID=3366085 RepID=UPI0037F7F78F